MDVDPGSGPLPLRAVDPAALSAAARIDALQGVQRLRAWADAQEQKLLAAMSTPGDAPGPGCSDATADKQFVREEIACALRLSPVSVNARLHVAGELVGRLPATLARLEVGEITMRHACVLIEHVAPLHDAGAAAVEARVLERAPSQTVSQFRVAVQRAVIAADPRSAEQRHSEAVAARCVKSRALADGMGSVFAVLPADGAQAVLAAVEAAAAVASGAGDERTTDQRRADALVALVTGQDPVTAATWQGRRPSVQVSVALSTLLGQDEQPGDLEGYGPVPASVARRMAGDPSGTWWRLVTDPRGHLVDYGRRRYAPPQDLVDHVVARDRVCRFPGCTRAARRCEIDHQRARSHGGGTAVVNLECLCPRHHHLKHETGWRVAGDPAGELTWTSPTGHRYHDPPGEYPLDLTAEGDTATEGSVGDALHPPTEPDCDHPPF